MPFDGQPWPLSAILAAPRRPAEFIVMNRVE